MSSPANNNNKGASGAAASAARPASTMKARSSLMGSLMGQHKNPGKHAVIDLLRVLTTDELEELPKAYSTGREAEAFLSSEAAPVDARNNFYLSVLAVYLGVAEDKLKHARGRFSSEEAAVKETVFNGVRQLPLRAFTALSREMSEKKDMKQIYSTLFETTVSTVTFYKHQAKAFKQAKVAAAEAAAKARSNAMVANIQARLNRLMNRPPRAGGSKRRSATRRGSRGSRGSRRSATSRNRK